MPTRITPSSFLFCVMLLASLLFGCAKQPPLAPFDATQAEDTWQQFQQAAENRLPAKPFRISGTLRYKTPNSGHRVNLLAWGNGEYPLRMDLTAGIGVTVARIQQDSDMFVAYSPQEEAAVYHPGNGDAMMRFGLPIPFSIKDFGNLLNGRYTKVFSNFYKNAALVPEGGFAYTLPPGRTSGTLFIDATGKPTRWESQPKGKSWTLEFSRYNDNTPASALPKKLTVRHSTTHKAIIIISERTSPETAYAQDQLTLTLPEGTKIKPLPNGN